MCLWCSQAAALLYPVIPSHAHIAGVAVNPVASHCAYGNSFHVGVQAVALMAALLCCSAAVVETVPVPIEPIPKKVTDRLFVVGRPHPPETVLKYVQHLCKYDLYIYISCINNICESPCVWCTSAWYPCKRQGWESQMGRPGCPNSQRGV